MVEKAAIDETNIAPELRPDADPLTESTQSRDKRRKQFWADAAAKFEREIEALKVLATNKFSPWTWPVIAIAIMGLVALALAGLALYLIATRK